MSSLFRTFADRLCEVIYERSLKLEQEKNTEIRGMLESVEEYNRTLEAKLAERTQSIRELMNSTGQGFLSIGSDLGFRQEYSNFAVEILGETLQAILRYQSSSPIRKTGRLNFM